MASDYIIGSVLLAMLLSTPGAAEDASYLPRMKSQARQHLQEARILADRLEKLRNRYRNGEALIRLEREREQIRRDLSDHVNRLCNMSQDLEKIEGRDVIELGARGLMNMLAGQESRKGQRFMGETLELHQLIHEINRFTVPAGVLLKTEEAEWTANQTYHAHRLWLATALAAGVAFLLLLLAARSISRRGRSYGSKGQRLAPGPAEMAARLLSSSNDALAAGVRIAGRYQVVRELGKGSMGRVYEVSDMEHRQPAAIKRLREELHHSERDIQRLVSQIHRIAPLKHPCIAEISSAFLDEGRIHLVSELVPGKNLGQVLDLGDLPLSSVKSIISQAAAALGHAHGAGLLHGDIKPSNILVTPQGMVKLLDFSLALLAKRIMAKRSPRGTGGSPAYVAVEQELGDACARSDIYSLGVVLYEMLTGRLPFEGPNFLAQKKSMRFRMPSQARPGLSKQVDLIVCRALHPDPARRFATARELSDQLQNVSEESARA